MLVLFIHYSDVMISAMASQITCVSIVYSNVCSGANQIKYQSSASLAFVREIHRWPVNSLHKGPVTRFHIVPCNYSCGLNPRYNIRHNLVTVHKDYTSFVFQLSFSFNIHSVYVNIDLFVSKLFPRQTEVSTRNHWQFSQTFSEYKWFRSSPPV